MISHTQTLNIIGLGPQCRALQNLGYKVALIRADRQMDRVITTGRPAF